MRQRVSTLGGHKSLSNSQREKTENRLESGEFYVETPPGS